MEQGAKWGSNISLKEDEHFPKLVHLRGSNTFELEKNAKFSDYLHTCIGYYFKLKDLLIDL